MNQMYANPVGLTKTDIYIVKNDINDKVYIGQSKDVAQRLRSHCKSSNKDVSLLSKAIQEYGKEHFRCEILEYHVKNADEREKYWITQYNSIYPNGYNILPGGHNPPCFFGEDHPNCVISNENVIALKRDLKNTSIPLSQLAKKYNISKHQVIRINQGVSRAVIGERYPIRAIPNKNGKLSDEDVEIIRELLQKTYFFNGEIARMFGVEVHTISDINKGISHWKSGITYPLRTWKSAGVIPLTYEQVTDIIGLLHRNDFSLNQIARQYHVNISVIQLINNGKSKKYRRNDISYPIRSFS